MTLFPFQCTRAVYSQETAVEKQGDRELGLANGGSYLHNDTTIRTMYSNLHICSIKT